MKLTQNQKELLKCIENKNIRKEIKKEFKRKIMFYRTNCKLLKEPVVDPKKEEFEINNSKFAEHLMNGILFKDGVETIFGNWRPWYESNSKEVEEKFNKLADNYISPKEHEDWVKNFEKPNEKGNKIISEEKPKRKIILPTGNLILDVDFHLNVLETFKDAYKGIERRKNEIHLSPTQKTTRGISEEKIKEKLLDSCDIDGLAELVYKKIIRSSEMTQALLRKIEKDKPTEEFISPEKAIEILSKREKPRAIDPITSFTPDQIETVIDWMNTWEQLKDTVIPIRFKEDFANSNSNESPQGFPIPKFGPKIRFTLEDMRSCFNESRLTHSLIGFKHSTFEDYIKSIEKNNH